MSTRRRATLSVGVAALIAAAPAAATGTTPARLTAAADAVSGVEAWVSYVPANPLATGRKVDLPEETRALARRAAGLVEEDESAFLGSYINDRDQVVVVAATLNGVELAQQRFAQTGVVVEQGATSINGTTELGLLVGQRSSTLAKILATWGPSPETGGVFLELSQEPRQEERDIIEATAAEKQIPIRVAVVPVAEGGPLDYRHCAILR